jgi:peptide-methionine (S)-S-oxide reductase
VSYAELLEVFWASHDPAAAAYSRQYRNAVFYLNAPQKVAAERSLEKIAGTTHGQIRTVIEPAGEFYAAEDYHQKYLLRRADTLLREFRAMYPQERDFIASTAATRINGYLGCNGKPEALEQELGQFGLSPQAQQWLVEYLSTGCRGFRGMTCPAPD